MGQTGCLTPVTHMVPPGPRALQPLQARGRPHSRVEPGPGTSPVLPEECPSSPGSWPQTRPWLTRLSLQGVGRVLSVALTRDGGSGVAIP